MNYRQGNKNSGVMRMGGWLVLLAVLFCAGCGGSGAVPKKKSTSKKTISQKSGSQKTFVIKTERPRVDVKPPVVKPPPVVQLPQKVYRADDDRAMPNVQRLARLGIRQYRSRRLILYTDIDPKIAAGLPGLIDRAYDAWVGYFGKLPPNRKGTPFQMTGYIMRDKALFQRAGLIPRNLRPFDAGRHRGFQFWMNDQKWDYYRRHLMIHEATHCFMYAVRDVQFPTWYMEGMAELFGGHWTDAKGVTHFRVMPSDVKSFAGFARIQFVQLEMKAGRAKTIADVMAIRPEQYLKTESYAWVWAVCKFLDSHPRYRKRFFAMCRVWSSVQFRREFRKLLNDDSARLAFDWNVFLHGLEYGYDLDRSAPVLRKAVLLTGTLSHRLTLRADRGWQSSGVRVEKGKRYRIAATGKFVLAKQPIAWQSEAQGVSIDYFNGQPLGKLLAMIGPAVSPVSVSPQISQKGISQKKVSKKRVPKVKRLTVFAVGRGLEFQATETGTVYLRVNDFWSRLSDNSGTLDVVITQK